MITIEEIKEANRDRSERWGMFNPDTQLCCHRPTNPETRHLIEFWYHAGLFTALGPDEYTALLESMSPAMLSGLTCATEVRLGPGNWNGEDMEVGAGRCFGIVLVAVVRETSLGERREDE